MARPCNPYDYYMSSASPVNQQPYSPVGSSRSPQSAQSATQRTIRIGHPTRVYPSSPNIDIRETTEHFYIVVEVPGLIHLESVAFTWLTEFNLAISGTVEHSFAGSGIADSASETEARYFIYEKNGSRDLVNVKHSSQQGDALDARKDMEITRSFYMNERKTGPFSRIIWLPTYADIQSISAVLEHGLLKISVAKLQASPTTKM